MSTKRLAGFALAVAALTLGLAPTQAQPAPGPERAPQAIDALPSVRAKGSKGWRIDVFAGVLDRVVLRAAKGKQAKNGLIYTTYAVSGTATGKRLKARLGRLGKINLRFKGKKTRRQLPRGCRGTPNRITRGIWRGVLRFKGEHGYTKVNVRKARGTVLKPGRMECDDGGGPPGAQEAFLTVTHGAFDETTTSLTVTKALRDGASPRFFVLRDEESGKVSINRVASYVGKPAEFTFSTPPQPTGTAEVRPKGPFSGEGHYSNRAWSGSLRVRLAGIRGRLPLTGSGFSALLNTLP